MDIHIQVDPNPVESKSKNPIGFESNTIHCQEYLGAWAGVGL